MAGAPQASEGSVALERVAIPSFALALTLAIELPLAALLAPRARRGEVLFTLLFANLVTHPIASSSVGAAWGSWLAVELAVCASEALALRVVANLPWPRAIGIALAANATSACAGLLLG